MQNSIEVRWAEDGNTAWEEAYSEAVDRGCSDEEAIDYADSKATKN